MTGFRSTFSALVFSASLFAAVTVSASAVTAQDASLKGSTLDLVATVLPLTATIEDMKGSSTDLSDDVRETLARSGDIEIRASGDDLILSVASDVLFEFDSADLTTKAQSSLTDVAEVLAGTTEGGITVVGHTDAKGSDDYNLDLSERRAQAVAKFLTENSVAGDRLSIEGRGETDPVAENEVDGKDNPEGRAKNRRVEFVVPKGMFDE